MPVSLCALGDSAHHAAAWNVYHAVFPKQWSRESFHQLIQTGQGLLAVEADGAAVGVAVWREVAGESELLTLAVRPEARRQGIGRMLMDAMHQQLDADGVSRSFLEVAEGNEAAFTLYAMMGYVACGRRRGYYPAEDGAAADALVMVRDIRRSEG